MSQCCTSNLHIECKAYTVQTKLFQILIIKKIRVLWKQKASQSHLRWYWKDFLIEIALPWTDAANISILLVCIIGFRCFCKRRMTLCLFDYTLDKMKALFSRLSLVFYWIKTLGQYMYYIPIEVLGIYCYKLWLPK